MAPHYQHQKARPEELNPPDNPRLPEITIRIGTFRASTGLEIPVEIRMNKNSLIKRLYEERGARSVELEAGSVLAPGSPLPAPGSKLLAP